MYQYYVGTFDKYSILTLRIQFNDRNNLASDSQFTAVEELQVTKILNYHFMEYMPLLPSGLNLNPGLVSSSGL